jgi:hypothetical protein
MLQSFQTQSEVRAPPRLEHSVDFVHDHGTCRPQHLPTALGCQEQVKRLRCSDEDVRWRPQHRRALRRGGVTRPDCGGDLHRREPHGLCDLPNLPSRLRQIHVDIEAQRLEGGDVHHADLVGQLSLDTLSKQAVQGTQERGERLARTRGRRDQRMLARADRPPSLLLGWRRFPEALAEPARYGRMKPG